MEMGASMIPSVMGMGSDIWPYLSATKNIYTTLFPSSNLSKTIGGISSVGNVVQGLPGNPAGKLLSASGLVPQSPTKTPTLLPEIQDELIRMLNSGIGGAFDL